MNRERTNQTIEAESGAVGVGAESLVNHLLPSISEPLVPRGVAGEDVMPPASLTAQKRERLSGAAKRK